MRQRRRGGAMSVVTRTTATRAPYRSSSSTPLASPMLAKIRPTSPRGSMPEPDEQSVADAAEHPEAGDELADARR